MIETGGSDRYSEGSAGEDPVDLRRYLAGLRRNWGLILAIVVAATTAAVALSLRATETYKTTTRLVLVDPKGDISEDSISRRLTTVGTLATTPDVLIRVAERVKGETAASLRDRVSSSAEPSSSIVNLSAEAPTPEQSAQITNAVAAVFLEREQSRAIERLRLAREGLLTELRSLTASATDQAQAEAIREQLSALAVTEATETNDLEVAEPALASQAVAAPRPVRNGILALFVSGFFAILVALGRDQLIPRVGGPRELSRLLNLPVLAKIPPGRGSGRRRPPSPTGAELASYEILQSLLSTQLPPTSQRMLLVTSAVPGEGKTQVVAGLGRALAHEGHDTLMVSADLRLPTLHERFGLEQAPGIAELLFEHLEHGRLPDEERINGVMSEALIRSHGSGDLRLLHAGQAPVNPSRLLAPDLIGRLLQELNRLPFAYVLVDSPPLLGLADAQTLATWCDSVLVVARPDRMALETASDLRDVLDRTETPALGLVLTGVRQTNIGGYYHEAEFDFADRR